jgi:hypothetical protein
MNKGIALIEQAAKRIIYDKRELYLLRTPLNNRSYLDMRLFGVALTAIVYKRAARLYILLWRNPKVYSFSRRYARRREDRGTPDVSRVHISIELIDRAATTVNLLTFVERGPVFKFRIIVCW